MPRSSGLASTFALCAGDLCWENYPQGALLVSVAAGADGSLYAVSYDNAILRRDAAGWGPICPPADSANVRWTGIAANGPDDVWVVGYRQSRAFEEVVYRWDGRRWLRPELATVAWPVIDGGAGSDILVSASLPSARRTSLGYADPAVYRWDGTALVAERLESMLYFGGLSVRGTEAWITGSVGTTLASPTTSAALHRSEAGWSTVAAPPGVYLAGIAADPAGGAFAGGESGGVGTLTRCERDGCRVVYQGSGDWLSVRGVLEDRVVLDSGTYGPNGFSPLPLPPNAAWCGLGSYRVAADGRLYSSCGPEIDRLATAGWTTELSLSRHSTAAIGGGGASDLLVGGNGLAHFDGSSWTSLIEPTTYEKYGYMFFDHAFDWIRGAAPDDQLLADISAAGVLSLVGWDGSSVAPLAFPASAQLLPGADGSLALATAAAPDRWDVQRRQPGEWGAPVSLPIPTGRPPTDVWIAPSGEIWAAAAWSTGGCTSASSLFQVVGGVAREISLGDWRVSGVVGDGAGGAWAWGRTSGCGGRDPVLTPGRVVRVARDGAIEDSGMQGAWYFVLTPAGDAFLSGAHGTWRHRAADAAHAWELVSTWYGGLAALPDGSVWAGRGNGMSGTALLRYRAR
ncbi:hypothetical protein [Anaeromyxobacter sp. SG66]|uniref:hypothetical protein n=1 Tax=Anaeromyxobacter sp. SG66 TaxID=2925410 RepID=UPI001F5A7D9E|nr:hypothetical protein [Anaeromyxobacter sp. SG66]